MSNRCKTCGKPIEYNGWTNYETWAVKLWIDNEEPLYDHAQSLARDIIDGYELAHRLKEWITDSAPDLPPSMYSDLMTAALDSVNWREIAKSLLEDVWEEAEA